MNATIRRILWALPVAFGVVTLTFFLGRILGGNPVETFLPPDADDELRARAMEQFGLDDSLGQQFLTFLSGVLHGDLGDSFTTGRPVVTDLIDRLPATFELAMLGVLFAFAVGIPLGVLAAVYREKGVDFFSRTVTLLAMAVPSFWLGIVLIMVFFVELQVLPGPVGRLPVGEQGPPQVTGLLLVDTLLAGQPSLWGTAFLHLLLPAFTVGVSALGPIARVTRSAMVEALQSDYVRTAVSVGHAPRTVYFRYALKNALLPIVTLAGSTIGYAFGGSILVEAVFGWPGVGQYALTAVSGSDFPALQGFVLFSALLYVAAFLVVDLLYMRIDPRTKVAR